MCGNEVPYQLWKAVQCLCAEPIWGDIPSCEVLDEHTSCTTEGQLCILADDDAIGNLRFHQRKLSVTTQVVCQRR